MTAVRRPDRGGLAPGLIMILVGMIFLLERLDYLSMGQVWRLWPVVVIALGVSQLVRPAGGRPSIFLLLLGIWLQISVLELWDLDFSESWPLLIIFIGASLVFDALVGRGRRVPQATATSSPGATGDEP